MVLGRGFGVGRAAFAGTLIGFDVGFRAIVQASVLFAGLLSAGAGVATAAFMASSIIALIAMLLQGRGTVAVLATMQQAPYAALLPVFAALSGGAAVAAGAALPTAMAIIALSTLLAGLGLVILSRANLARVARFLPYSVSSGFLCSTGALLMLASIAMPERAAGAHFASQTFAMVQIALVCGMGLLIWLGHRLAAEAGVLAALALGIGGFYLFVLTGDITMAEAVSLGFLPASPARIDLTHLAVLNMGAVDFAYILAVLPNMGALVTITVLSFLLSTHGIETATGRDMSGASVMQATGLANVVGGLFGGGVTHPSSSATMTAQILRADHPILPFAIMATLLAAILALGPILAHLPVFVAAGFLFFIGFSILDHWLLADFRRRPLADWLISAGLVGVSLIWGILFAVAIGVLVASLLFVVTYGQVPILRQVANLSQRRSALDRSPREMAVLDQAAHRVYTILLEGFLFFGTADQLGRGLKRLMVDATQETTFILDATRLGGVDSAALALLSQMARHANSKGHRLIVAGASDAVRQQIDRAQGPRHSKPELCVNPDLALEQAETRLLKEAGVPSPALDGLEAFMGLGMSPEQSHKLRAYLSPRRLAAGEILVRQGEVSGDIFIVDRGRLAVVVTRPDGHEMRLRSMIGGAVLGEVAFYADLPRTADIRAEIETDLLVMTSQSLARLGAEDQGLLAYWHHLMARALADKLARTTRLLSAA